MHFMTTSWKNGNTSARKAGKKIEREEGVSEDRSQAKPFSLSGE
jgi:hypothetical protein